MDRENDAMPFSNGIQSAHLRQKILVVDDNLDVAVSMATLLKLLGHSVKMAHDGAQALEIARAFQPNAILLDIGLPGMDGFEVAENIRAEAWSHGTVIIAITGYNNAGDRQRSKDVGINFHLAKPVDTDIVLRIVETVH